ncbi:hypothetical protein RX327_31630 [Bradyrhizobium sp. BEA-2-5]|uniref:hypothetical protein n=1 Tax=Bradyrhizobium sp. BEA-2-5 TaxID=3080015 RepID=UPI00293F7229|nr:hypothetical protein [Bradyrhizobium sp. BEA-2-5]WOH80323.1 hypothetical protein RX327_31630 [Bradyrhizobium sp. BEA-2-5]
MDQFEDDILGAIYSRRQIDEASAPLEDAWERTTWRRILAGYNVDLGIAAVIYLVAIAIALSVVFGSHLTDTAQGFGTGLQIIFGTAVFGTFIELLRRTYDAAIKRLATIDLFTSEILSIMRVFASANIIGDFIRLYDRIGLMGNAPVQTANASTQAMEATGAFGFADAARKEDYFTIFKANAGDLASLDPAVVNDITAFYTFLKASRDATGAMPLWTSPQYQVADKQKDVIAIIFNCFLMSVHGQRALEELIGSEENRQIANDIFAGVMLQCFAFLYYVIPSTDFRWPRIEQRRAKCESLRLTFRYEIPLERHSPKQADHPG